MTTPAVTVPPHRSLADVADLLLDLGIDRLPVLDGDELVGIVTRSDLARAFVRSDEEIEAEIRREVVLRAAWMPRAAIVVTVVDGAVMLEGEVDTETAAKLIESQTGRVPGVMSIESRLSWPQRAGIADAIPR
jgi:predicted transcriptional regulator